MTREEALNKAINIVRYFEAHFAKSKEAREDAVNIIEALEQLACEMTVEEYRQRMIQAFHNADCDELIAVCVLPTEKEFKHLEWLLKNHYKKEPCEDVPDNDGNIYKCSCGYGWDKSKVVRHHFCPNCGKPVDSSIKPCEDCISRQAAIDAMYALCDTGETLKENPWRDNPHIDAITDALDNLPPVTPTRKKGHWIDDKCFVCGKGIEDLIDSREWYRNEETKFCPFCGIKLVEPQKSEVRDADSN